MASSSSAALWEAMFAAYDQSTYQAVLELLSPEDVVLDIGAGDLRLSRQMARVVDKVYAVEINTFVLEQGLQSSDPLPEKLTPICGDARALDFPTDTTVGVLLMRHCTHFRLYSEKLRMAGAQRLITNARWHMSVEVMNLQSERISFRDAGMGWYACSCGSIGFQSGPAEEWSNEMDQVTHEVVSCPQCREV